MRVTIELDRPRPTRWRRRRWAAIAVAAALLVPAAAFANHQFTDVPTSHTFHGDIADAYGARLTNGCSATKFCPDDSVSRGQMTAFLNRGLGRMAHGGINGVLSTTDADVSLGTATIKAGNVTGGWGLVFVSTSVNVYTSQAGCPCEMRLYLREQGGTDVAFYVVVDLPAIPSGDGDTDEIAAMQGWAQIPTGVNKTYQVIARRTVGTAQLNVYGSLDVMYFPFNGNGDAVGTMVTGQEFDNPRD